MTDQQEVRGGYFQKTRIAAGRLFLVIAAVLVLWSVKLPYWRVRVEAPQYPKGLHLVIYPNRLMGDVREIDSLNHYIGMRPLEHGAKLERKLAIAGIVLAALGLLLSAFLSARWALFFSLPAVVLPFLFTGDLYWWLRDYGLNLNPKAPLNHSVRPFIPVILGRGKIAQFQATAGFEAGFYLVLLAGLLALVGLWLKHRRKQGFFIRAGMVGVGLLLLATNAQADTLVVDKTSRYPDLAQAVVSAGSGDTILVRGGTHAGPIIIDKSLTIIGEQAPVIDGQGRGTVVRITAPGVTVRGMTIRRSGSILSQEDSGILVVAPRVVLEGNKLEEVLFGVTVRHAPETVIRKNALRGQHVPVARRGDLIRVWRSDDVVIEGNQAYEGRDIVLWFSQRITVRGNDVRFGRYGLHFMYCNDAVVERNRLSQNSVGIYLMYSADLRLLDNRLVSNRGPSGYGLGLKDMERAYIKGNVLADNRTGIFMEHASGKFEHNVIGYNDVGAHLFPTAIHNGWVGNSFIENGEQVFNDGASSSADNRWEGNYWSDYRGFDADGDGIGDIPYRAVRLFERLTQQFPVFRLYAGSPAAEAIDFAAKAFPVFAPQAKLEDFSPRMHP